MIRNNLIAIGVHFGVLLMNVLMMDISTSFVCGVFTILLTALCYYFSGYSFMAPIRGKRIQLLSVAGVSLIGLGIGMWGWSSPGGFHWMFYLIYNLYLFVFAQSFHLSPEPKWAFWMFVVPSLLLWLGALSRAALTPRA